jgi:hypothetical protein
MNNSKYGQHDQIAHSEQRLDDNKWVPQIDYEKIKTQENK